LLKPAIIQLAIRLKYEHERKDTSFPGTMSEKVATSGGAGSLLLDPGSRETEQR
jgi:hypothetical protein